MARHVHDGRDYWTLPGGGVEPGESLEQAALREACEETRLVARVVRPLYRRSYRNTSGRDVVEHCLLVEVDGEPQAVLGHDPELDAAAQMLVGLAWRPLDDVRDDVQVSRVLAALAGG